LLNQELYLPSRQILLIVTQRHATNHLSPGGSDSKESAWVPSLGWDDPLEEGTTTHSSILAWRIPRNRGDWWAVIHGVSNSQK